MKSRILFLILFLIAAVLLTAMCAAQTTTPVVTTPAASAYDSKFDFSAGYIRQFNNLSLSALGPQNLKQTFLGGLNGAAISATYNFKPNFGLKAEFAAATQSGDFATSGKNYSGMVGPVIRKTGKVSPFAEVLVGLAHQTVSGFGLSGGQNAFTAKAGGGVDFMVSQHFGIRTEAAYVWTAYHTERPTDLLVISSRQNNADLGAGIVVKF
jgi:opacity protein-like surface antigen